MKIAIQLFGHLRSFRDTFPYLKNNILDKYDYDLFIHTWDEEDHTDPTWHRNEKSVSPQKTDKEELLNLYNPKEIIVDSNNLIQYKGSFNAEIGLRGINSMLYSQHEVNKLRYHHERKYKKNYDLVIMLRPDVMPLAILELERYRKEIEFYSRSSIHFYKNYHNHVRDEKLTFTPLSMDLFYIATPETMNDITDIYCEFKRYYVDYPCVHASGVSSPEGSYLEYLIEKGIAAKFYTYPYVVKRAKGNNHLKAAMDQLENYEMTLPLPDFLLEERKKENSFLANLLGKLSASKINKIQKQITRIKRQLDTLNENLEQIKGIK